MLFNKLKNNYFYNEIKQISRLLGIVALVWAFYTYGSRLAGAALSGTGITYITFLLVAVVLGQVIRLYYRIMVIKYTEKR